MVIYQVSHQTEIGTDRYSAYTLRHFRTKAGAEKAFERAVAEGRYDVDLTKIVARGKDAILSLLDDIAQTYPVTGTSLFSASRLRTANGSVAYLAKQMESFLSAAKVKKA